MLLFIMSDQCAKDYAYALKRLLYYSQKCGEFEGVPHDAENMSVGPTFLEKLTHSVRSLKRLRYAAKCKKYGDIVRNFEAKGFPLPCEEEGSAPPSEPVSVPSEDKVSVPLQEEDSAPPPSGSALVLCKEVTTPLSSTEKVSSFNSTS